LLHLATSNTAPRHKKRANGRVYVILINSEKLQTQTLVELAEELLTGGSRGLVGGVCVYAYVGFLLFLKFTSLYQNMCLSTYQINGIKIYISRNRRRPESAEL
jgi:hypothetical protein